jgi:methylated-DNA-[protein]-cysteine S-methyltransferase
VGTACARNPVPIVVPCHRVLPGSGGIGNYGGGPERKRALLALEGVL